MSVQGPPYGAHFYARLLVRYMCAIQLGVCSCAYRLIYLIVKSIYYIVYECVFVLGIMYP